MPAHHSPNPTSAPTVAAPDVTVPDLASAARAAGRGTGPSGPAGHLAVEDVFQSFGDRRVLSDISFTAAPGDRIGLIGENGTGKSTLLRIIAGIDEPASGSVSPPGSVGLLRQELPYSDRAPVARVLDDAQRPTLAALADIERLGVAFAENPSNEELADSYSAALDAAERSGAWTAAARRGEVITGLGLGGISERRGIGTLSGGQRLRLALAALLLEAPQTLLLDEPSNHLDDDSVRYLERVLSGWPGIVIVASHDRALLDAVSTRILDLDPLPVAAETLADAVGPVQGAAADATATTAPTPAGATTDDIGSGLGVRVWGMGYSAARAARRAELMRWWERYNAEQEEIAALRHEIEVGSREVNRKHEAKSEVRMARKYYADKDARVTARRARNARVRLETLERGRVRRPPEPLRFALDFAEAAPADDAEILRLERAGVAGRLAPISLAIAASSRLMLTGPNGAGKSTLLSLLAGALAPDTGSVECVAPIGVGYLPQEAVFEDLDRTAAEHYRGTVGDEAVESRPLAALGLLAERDADRPIGALSVGQRRRLALATILADPPALLLLDEPTNHLSLSLVEDLEGALDVFPGALVIATHDRWLRSRWAGAELRIGGTSL